MIAVLFDKKVLECDKLVISSN